MCKAAHSRLPSCNTTDINIHLIQLRRNVSRRASMCYSCTMMSPKDTSPEEEGRDANGVNWDGAEREEGAAEFVCRDQN